MNQYICGLIQTKLQRCSLPTGVFTSLLTLLSQAVIPLIYYGMVIGWGVAVTPSRRIMNHVGQNISSYPVTPKEVITRGRKRFWWSTAALKSLLWRWRDSFSDYPCSVLVWLRSFSWREGQRHPHRTVMVDLKPPCYTQTHQWVKAKGGLALTAARHVGPFLLHAFGFWLLQRGLDCAEQMCQTARIGLALCLALLSCRCDENDIWGSWKVAAPPVSRTLVEDDSDSSLKSPMNEVRKCIRQAGKNATKNSWCNDNSRYFY